MRSLIEEDHRRKITGPRRNMARMRVTCNNSPVKVRNAVDLCSQSIPDKLLHDLHIWIISH